MNKIDIDALPFQARVQPWMMECFGPMIAGDREERNHRFFEEAAELVQSCGTSASEAHQLVDYVWNRPVGEPNQEVGGVMVTLAALCLANDLDMHEAAETELARIWTKVEAIRAKQAAKPKHSPLPEHVAPTLDLTDEQRVCVTIADERMALHGLPLYSDLLARVEALAIVPEGDAPDHDDDIAVDVFARVMKTKLAEQRAKGYDGWEGCGYQVLSNLLHRCVAKGDPRDVAIVAMMLYHHSAQVVPASDVEPSDAWQPIETAPGGGTTILLRLSKSVSQGRYDPHPSRPEHPWEFIDRSNGASFVNHMVEGNLGPSHWMPMPGAQA
jgi:hypothetical protein